MNEFLRTKLGVPISLQTCFHLLDLRMYLQERSEKAYRKQFDVTSKVNKYLKSSKTLIFLTQTFFRENFESLTLTQNFVVLFDEF